MNNKYAATILIAAIGFASAFLSTATYGQDSTRSSVDWNGYYAGTVPCGSCEGIDTWLYLNEFAGKTQYNLVETYQQDKPETFRASGKAKWRKDGSTLALKGKGENRVLFISEGYAEFLGEGSKPSGGKSAYTLWKQDAYAGNGQQLLVNPRQVKKDGNNGTRRVTFTGVMNFEHTTEGGHKSLRARYTIDCGKKSYEMPELTYFAKDFATGKKIHTAKNNDNPPQPFSGKEDVMRQAAEAYCGQ